MLRSAADGVMFQMSTLLQCVLASIGTEMISRSEDAAWAIIVIITAGTMFSFQWNCNHFQSSLHCVAEIEILIIFHLCRIGIFSSFSIIHR